EDVGALTSALHTNSHCAVPYVLLACQELLSLQIVKLSACSSSRCQFLDAVSRFLSSLWAVSLHSVCTSCTLCEPCSFSHDPSHNLVRARTPLSIPEHGSPAPDHSRFYRRGDRSFRKAEKQRLKAEKRLLKAEVKEIRKQLRMERRGIQWSSSHRDGSSSPVLLQPRATQHNSPERPKRPCPLVVPAMTAAFLDENLPDGTRLRPGTKFIKYWKMRNTGTLSWSAETKVKSQTAAH
ncbi:next to BRCA1 gene 1 protein-like, partial [Haplochromis burtoni]|uniref:next to BRCA1 gene 1 protein-like n=1 Tax=Haplochromis burtoni TaxID=8153 RepID=UPI001C2D3D08